MNVRDGEKYWETAKRFDIKEHLRLQLLPWINSEIKDATFISHSCCTVLYIRSKIFGVCCCQVMSPSNFNHKQFPPNYTIITHQWIKVQRIIAVKTNPCWSQGQTRVAKMHNRHQVMNDSKPVRVLEMVSVILSGNKEPWSGTMLLGEHWNLVAYKVARQNKQQVFSLLLWISQNWAVLLVQSEKNPITSSRNRARTKSKTLFIAAANFWTDGSSNRHDDEKKNMLMGTTSYRV